MSFEQDRRDPWLPAAVAVAAFFWLLLLADILWWHPGYARGDEMGMIAAIQRLREGAPWDFSRGWFHRALLLASMSLAPGQLWAPAVPGLLALALEGVLLFALGRRIAGPRAGFFAVWAGFASAFTLVRARTGLSLALFPAEWLLMVWWRTRTAKPWHWVLWGLALGVLFLEYDAWMPMAALLMLLPFLGPVPRRQWAWEALGLGLWLGLCLDAAGIGEYWGRRRTASLAQAGAASPGWRGLWDLVWGALHVTPYLEPGHTGVIPCWALLLLPWGLRSWASRFWVPLLYLALGLGLTLAGGAAYGLPAHRAIALWPALALITGLGLDRLSSLSPSPGRRMMLALLLLAAAGQQLWAWQSTQRESDAFLRGPIRDLKRAAAEGWALSQREHLPLVTETDLMEGAHFRFLTGHAVPPAVAQDGPIVAFMPWAYQPAVRGHFGKVATFQEEAGYAPMMVGILSGPTAQQALEAERSLRPLLCSGILFPVKAGALALDWLRKNPKAGPWARTLAIDDVLHTGWYSGTLSRAWALEARQERLVSARPLLLAAQALEGTDPVLALDTAHQARVLDPFYADAWALERRLLAAQGRAKDIERLDHDSAPLAERGLLIGD